LTSYIVTGASGFAGIHFLNSLIDLRETSEYICPVSFKHGGHKERFASILKPDLLNRIEIIETDLAKERIKSIVSESLPHTIVNFASESHVDRSITSPDAFFDNNIQLMINVLEFARNSKSRLIHISTDEVYGEIPIGSTNFEWERNFMPSNPYSASKVAQEALIISYCRTFNVDVTIMNFTNLIGEGQNQEKFIPRAISRILNGKVINIDTDKSGLVGSRKYLDVRVMSKAVMKILKLDSSYLRETFDVATSVPLKFHVPGIKETTNEEIIQFIAKKLNKEPLLTKNPSPRQGYDLRYDLTTSRMMKLGFDSSFDLYDRLAEVVDFTLQNPFWLEKNHPDNSDC
jgi:dTDP-glucose 4,6-dehydratase